MVQCILAYPDLNYPNPHLSELQINEIHSNFSVQFWSLSITKHIIWIIHLSEPLEKKQGPKEFG